MQFKSIKILTVLLDIPDSQNAWKEVQAQPTYYLYKLKGEVVSKEVVVSFTFSQILQNLLDRRLSGSESQSGHSGARSWW
jgi:hypothetical protein